MVVMYEPLVAYGLKPDLVLVYDGVWFIVEFRTRLLPARDIEWLVRYKRVVEEYVKPKEVIPILAYVYNRPSELVARYARLLRPIVVLLLRGGTYHVLHENLF